MGGTDTTMSLHTILIVDDEYHIRDGLLSYDWARLGFVAVGSAASGTEALEYFGRRSVDVLLTDIRIPNVDGLSLSEYVHKHQPGTLCVLISGHKEFEYAASALRLGVVDYLLKPIDMDELDRTFRRVKSLLSQSHDADGPTSAEAIATASGEHSSQCQRKIEMATDYIRRNYQENLTLRQLASEFSMNDSYLSSQFKKHTGQGFSDFLTDIRVERAKQLLSSVDLRVYEVADMVGFNNAKYFADVFKRRTGETPQRYRDRRYG
jgi:YesN/AraC family two-component response regulator